MNLEQNQAGRLVMLKDRINHCVCKYCGGRLDLKQVAFAMSVEARAEIFCPCCNRVEFGVEKEIYDSAKGFVEATDFNSYPDKDDNGVTRRMTVGKVCEIMQWHDRQIGILSHTGYRIDLSKGLRLDGDSLILTNEDMAYLMGSEEG